MKPEHYERKHQKMVSLPPTVIRWLEVYGETNLSVGILELVRFVTDVDALYPLDVRQHWGTYRSPLRESHESRKNDADRLANWSDREQPLDDLSAPRIGSRPAETIEQRFERIKANTLIAARAQHAARQTARDELRVEAERRELQALEDQAFERSRAAFKAHQPLPEHLELDDAGLRSVRTRVLKRCRDAFGWESGRAPRGFEKVIPPSVVLPTDNPFDDDTGPQGAPGDAPPDPGPMTGQERADIAAPEHESSQGPTAPAQESEPDPSADIAEPKF